MKNESHATADLEKLGELIDGIEVAMLTTHAADGSMVSRPLQTLEFDSSGELVFFTAADSRKIEEMRANPDVNLAYANPGKQIYVSVRGNATIDRDRATIDELWSAMQKIFFPQGKDDPNLVVLRVLDFAKGMLSKEPADLGKHGKLSGA